MNRKAWEELIEQLRGQPYQFGLIAPDSPVHAIEFDAGLTDAEVIAIETRFAFRFPPDLREFATGTSGGRGFRDWRSRLEESMLCNWLDIPATASSSTSNTMASGWKNGVHGRAHLRRAATE